MTSAEFAAWRAAQCLTQAEAAQLLQVSPTQVYRLEHGLSRITSQTALLCQLLEIPSIRDAAVHLVYFQPRHRKPRGTGEASVTQRQ